MKREYRFLQIFKTLAMCMLVSVAISSCSDDDGDGGSSSRLSGTTWKILSDTDDEELAGMSITFNKNGNVKFSPVQIWSYAKWSETNGKLKIVLGEGRADDYIEGAFVINGKKATYTYSWYDYDGKWGGEDICVMTLEKQ